VHQVCAESYAVGFMDEYDMTVVIQIDFSCALSALPKTRMTSLSYTLLAYSFTNIADALALNSHLQNQTERDGRLTARIGF
jgi:hypothetical protein